MRCKLLWLITTLTTAVSIPTDKVVGTSYYQNQTLTEHNEQATSTDQLNNSINNQSCNDIEESAKKGNYQDIQRNNDLEHTPQILVPEILLISPDLETGSDRVTGDEGTISDKLENIVADAEDGQSVGGQNEGAGSVQIVDGKVGGSGGSGNVNGEEDVVENGDGENPEGGEEDQDVYPEESPGNGTETEEVPPQEPVAIEANFDVNTSFGPVRGHPWRRSRSIISYLDIPYGQFNRFQAPDDPNTWAEVRDVLYHNVRCPQVDRGNLVGDLDCLTLSIFTPNNVENASILFYIHGNNANQGSGNPSVYGPEYVVAKGVILVLPNYRLGALGFLCLQNETAPGNAALKDLSLALRWIKRNIDKFGGDPNKITVSGDGSAGALAGYLALSFESRENVRQVISESGSFLSHWAIERNPIILATTLAQNIRHNFPAETFEDDLFDSISIEQLMNSTRYVNLSPCIELESNTSFISNNPWKILQSGLLNISFIVGSANHAGLQDALAYDADALTELNDNFAASLPNDLDFGTEATKIDTSERLKQQYFATQNITAENLVYLSLYHSDMSYLSPDIRLARALKGTGATVYLFEFSFMGELNKELLSITNAPRYGATKGDLAGYLFTQDGRITTEESVERRMIDLITDLWVSFIQDSQPNAEGVTWNEFESVEDSDERWLSIDAETIAMAGYHPSRLRIWSDIYRDYFVDNLALTIKASRYVFYATLLCLFTYTKHIIF